MGHHGEVHFVGSVPFGHVGDVFRTLSRGFSRHVRRIPDGEVGKRNDFVIFQVEVFARHPLLEEVEGELDWRMGKKSRHFRPRPEVTASDIHFDDLGYAAPALDSWRHFRQLKQEGIIHAACRFMVALPSPFNVMSVYIAPAARREVDGPYRRALLDEMRQICRAVPDHELAIQWDVSHDMQSYDGARSSYFDLPRAGIISALVDLGEAVPVGVELGFHLCYGDAKGKHFIEPKDAGAMVEVATGILDGVKRPVQWIHMPVPVDRSDDGYFQPLADLKLRPETTIYLGLVHDSDGIDGTKRRIAAAEKYLPDFGIATECGFGRRPPESFPGLLELHRKIASGVA